MRYDDYENKLIKRIGLVKTIKKHKILIISILSLLFITLIFFMVGKGITLRPKFSQNIEYGSDLELGGGAFMSSYEYQYKNEDGQWINEAPTEPGEYEVRIVSKGFFGNNRYSDPTTFSIKPRELLIEIKDSSFEYGSLPSVVTNNLNKTDHIDFTDAKVKYEVLENNDILAYYDESTIKIYNDNSLDVTECYSISSIKKNITLTQRDIEITIDSSTKEYDGDILNSSSYSITNGSLSQSDRLEIVYKGEQLEVGSSQLDAYSVNIYNEDQDVTSLYNINVISGQISVIKRNLVIETGNLRTTFDGNEHGSTNFKITGGNLVPGDKIAVIGSNKYTHAGTYVNHLDYIITNSNNVDVTKNYNIKEKAGRITILKAEGKIFGKAANAIYSGKEFLPQIIDYDNVIPACASVTPIINQKIIDAGDYEYSFLGLKIFINGEDYSDSFNFEFFDSSVSVLKRTIEIQPNQMIKEYDGLPLYSDSIVFLNNTSISEFESIVFTSSEITNVGQKENEILSINIYRGNIDSTNNYEIRYSKSTIEVTKRKIYISPLEVSYEYDGMEKKSNHITSDNLVFGHTIRGICLGHGVNCGDYQNQIESYSIYSEDIDVTSNYDVKVLDGIFHITPRHITIKPLSLSITYDGLKHTVSEAEVIEGSIVDGDTIAINASGGGVEVGSYKSEITTVFITNNDMDVTYNYVVSMLDGTVEIKKRDIIIRPLDISRDYNGQLLYAPNDIIGDNLASGHRVVGTCTGSNLYCGVTKSNINTYAILDGDNDVTKNYNVTVASGSILVTKAKVTLKPQDTIKVYTGNEITSYQNYEIVSGRVYDIIEVSVDGTLVNYGRVQTSITSFKITSSTGDDLSYNYEIALENGYLEVLKCDLIIKPKDVSKEYDGTPLSSSVPVIVDGIDLPDLAITIETTGEAIYASSNVCSQIVSHRIYLNNEDVTNNYNVSYLEGKLNILPRPLEITFENVSKEYDGLADANISYDVLGLLDGDIENINYSFINSSVGVHKIDYKVSIYNQDYDISSSYEIKSNDLNLTINKRSISIKPKDLNTQYDGTIKNVSEYDILLGSLAINDTLTITTKQSAILPCEKTNSILNYSIKNDLNEDVSAFYDVSYFTSSFVITRRKVILKPQAIEVEYDGKEKIPMFFEVISANTFVQSQMYAISFEGSQTTPGVCVSSINYIRVFLNIEMTEEVTDAYDFTFEESTITVLKRAISVKANDASKEYDGTPLSSSGYDVVNGSIILGNTVVASYEEIKYPSESKTNSILNDFKIYSKDIDITEYYDIRFIESILKITKKDLNVELLDQTLVYNGDKQGISTYNTTGLCDSDILYVETNTLKNIGSVLCEVTRINVLNEDVDVTDCYNITSTKATLTISKRNILIKPIDHELEFDGNIKDISRFETVNSEGYYSLVLGHTALVDIYAYQDDVKVDPKEIGEYVLKIDSNTLSISDGDEDVTSNYNITIVDGSLEIVKQIIYIKTSDLVTTYDGTYHSSIEYTVTKGSLLPGDQIVICNYTTECNVGEYDNVISFKICDLAGFDSSNYKIVVSYGKIEIKALSAQISTSSAEFEYNGYAQSKYDDVDVLNLVQGHQIVVLSYTSKINVGSYTNIVSVKILDSSSNDVTANYDLSDTTGFGTIKITPIGLKITTSSLNLEYDGLSHSNKEYSMDGSLASTDSISVDSSTVPSIKYCSENGTLNELVFNILNNQGENVISNYDIEYVYGTLSLDKISLTIYTYDGESIYHGALYSSPNFGYGAVRPLGADTPTVLSQTKVIYAGEYDNILEIGFKNSEGVDVSSSYDITYSYGKITIYPRSITVAPADYDEYYDGAYHNITSYSLIGDSIIISGDNLSIVTSVNEKNVIDTTNTISSYTVVSRDGVDVSSSYSLNGLEASFKIKKLAVSIKACDVSKVYDGQFLEATEFEYLGQNTFFEDNVVISTVYKQKKVCSYTNNQILSIIIFDSEGIDVASNYDISFEESSYEITPRTICVGPMDVSKVYDGTKLVCDSLKFYEDTSLAEYDYAEFKCLYESIYTYQSHPVNVITEITIYDSDNTDVTNCYIINKDYQASITILQKALTLAPESKSVTYDGNTHYITNIVSEGLIGTDYISDFVINGSAKYTNDDVTTQIISYKIFNADGIDITTCYKATILEGTINILQKKIVVETASASKEYDGTPLTSNSYTITDGEFVGGDSIILNCTGSQTKVGQSYNTFSYRIVTQTNEDVTVCYDLSDSILGVLKVIKGDVYKDYISVTSNQDGVIYLRNQSYGVYNGSTIMGQSLAYTSANNPLKFLAYAYEALGVENATVKVEYGSASSLIPQYTYDNVLENMNDVHPIISGSQVTFNTYLYNFFDFKDLILPDIYKQDESTYYQFVLNNYLQIPDQTKKHLLDVAAKNISSGSLYDTIMAVGSFVRNKIPYNEEYDSRFDIASDAAVYFFNGATSGICTHYAVAACMMLRALGIPARYVSGYKVDASQNQTYLINPATGHAWVEVYIKGLGWINLEVTPENRSDITDEEVIIYPLTQSKIYDGTPLSCPTYAIGTKNLPRGYSVKVFSITGEITSVGIAQSKITNFAIYDSNGNDVTGSTKYILRAGKLVVNKIPILVQTASDSKVYDGLPLINQEASIVSGSLLDGDYVDLLVATGSITNYSENGSINGCSITILNQNGDNVTNLYYSIEYDYGILFIEKAPLIIQTGTATKTYDGTPLTASDITVIGVLNHHIANYYTTGTITEIGSTSNTYEIAITDTDGINAIFNYQIYEELGVLTVREFDFYLKTKSFEKEYDGTSLVLKELERSPDLPSGYTYEVISNSSITEVGSIDNLCSVVIYNSLHEDVTSQFKISLSYGTLTVLKRNITLASANLALEYTGDYLSDSNYTITNGSLVEGTNLSVSYVKYKDIGSYRNSFNVTKILENNKDVTDCYNITYEYGSFDITRIGLTIKTEDKTKIFDGQALVQDKYELDGNILDCHNIVVNLLSTITYPGSIMDTYSIEILQTEYSFNDYYYIKEEEMGILTVLKAKISIKTGSASKEYDGTPLVCNAYEIEGDVSSLHDYNVSLTGTITYISSNVNYAYNFANTTILQGDVDVTRFYEITYDYGVLTLNKKAITLRSLSGYKEYDGVKLQINGGNIISGSVVSGDRIEYNCTGYQIEEGISDNYFKPAIYNLNNYNVTNSYDIELEYGTLEVVDTRKTIYISVLSYTTQYTGSKISIPSKLAYVCDESKENMLDNSLSISLNCDSYIVGSYLIEIESYKILDTNQNDITATYKVIFKDVGYLTIKRASITVESKSLSVIYDGLYHTYEEYEIISGRIGSNHYAIATFTQSIIDVGKKDNLFTIKIYDENGNDVTNYYDITYVYGTLEVTK